MAYDVLRAVGNGPGQISVCASYGLVKSESKGKVRGYCA